MFSKEYLQGLFLDSKQALVVVIFSFVAQNQLINSHNAICLPLFNSWTPLDSSINMTET